MHLIRSDPKAGALCLFSQITINDHTHVVQASVLIVVDSTRIAKFILF
jgi:hypothetical protein